MRPYDWERIFLVKKLANFSSNNIIVFPDNHAVPANGIVLQPQRDRERGQIRDSPVGEHFPSQQEGHRGSPLSLESSFVPLKSNSFNLI